MLSSPGHSPRHILPPPSPSPSLQSLDDARATTSGRDVMGPPPPKKARRLQTVLDEDTYVAAIEKIVERDFFPDIPKLQNKLEWLEAVRSGDPVLIREAQLNIIQRLKGTARGKEGTPMFNPDTFATPSSVVSVAPSPAFTTPSGISVSEFPAGLSDETGPSVDTFLSLDEFMKRYTSEDNDSFCKIIEKVNKKKREKYRFLTDKGVTSPQLKITGEDKLMITAEDRKTDGYGTSNQPIATLNTWSYKAKNLLMYDSAEREDAPLTETEKEERVHGPPKSINTRSTRFHEKVFDSKLPEEDVISILYTPVHGGTTPMDTGAGKRYDLEDLRRTPQLGDNAKLPPKAGTAGYSYVSTPSPAPGVDASPFMTWGEIEGTPMRLEMEDTPVGIGGSGDGPHFKIPAPPARDHRAHTLSREAARSIRERSRLRQPSCSPSPARGSSTPGLGGLSAAAQRFVNKAMAKSCASVDAKLRASYGASTTPGTPRMARNAVRSREGSVGYSEGSLPPSVREGSVIQSPSPSPACRVGE